MVNIHEGEKLPTFTGHITDGESIEAFDLADHLGEGPVVLGFFPFAYTSPCTEQMCELRDNFAALNEIGAAKVFGVSADSPFTLKHWKGEQGFTFPLVSDWNGDGRAKLAMTYPDKIRGLKDPFKRAAVVLDKEGTVVFFWQTEDPGIVPPMDEIKAAVEKAQ